VCGVDCIAEQVVYIRIETGELAGYTDEKRLFGIWQLSDGILQWGFSVGPMKAKTELAVYIRLRQVSAL
jgi:hypothetical protein